MPDEYPRNPRYRSAESQAKAYANLPGGRAKPGEVRKRPLSHGLPSVDDHRASIRAGRPAGELSSWELTVADMLAQVHVQIDRTNASIERAPSLTSHQTAKKFEQMQRNLRLAADLQDQLERASQTRVDATKNHLHGQPVTPPVTEERAGAVARVLAQAGAVPNASPEVREQARLLAEALASEEADARAVAAEFDQIPTTRGTT